MKKQPSKLKAICWASGRIDFVKRKPKGALVIAEGPARKLRPIVQMMARTAYDGKTLLVPGVPEAELMKWDPVNAVTAFCYEVRRRLNPAAKIPEGVIRSAIKHVHDAGSSIRQCAEYFNLPPSQVRRAIAA